MIMIGNRQVMPIKFNSYLGESREIFNFNSKSKRYLYLLKINQIVQYLSTKTINKLNKRYQLRVSFKFIWLFIQLAEPWFVSQCNFIPCTGDWIGVLSVCVKARKVILIIAKCYCRENPATPYLSNALIDWQATTHREQIYKVFCWDAGRQRFKRARWII